MVLPVKKETVCLVDGAEVELIRYEERQDTIVTPVLNSKVADPKWNYVDPAGHYHAFDAQRRLPTTHDVVTEKWWCLDCHDDHETSELRCTECAAVIVPGFVDGPHKHVMPGPRVMTVVVAWPPPLKGPGAVVSVVIREKDTPARFGFMRVAMANGRWGGDPYREMGVLTLTGDLHEALR